MDAAQAGRYDGATEVFAVIDALINRKSHGWGVRELAEEISASRSTVNRILAKLAEDRLASRDLGGTYSVGPRMRVLAGTLQGRHPVFVRGLPVLSRLSKATGATAILAISSPDPTMCFVLAAHEPDIPVRYSLRAGLALPTHAGAVGQAILMGRGLGGMPENLRKFTDDSLDTLEQLKTALAAHQRVGYVVSVAQHIVDAAGIAKPLTIGEHHVGSISLSRPLADFREAEIEPTAELLTQEITGLEAELREWAGKTESSPQEGLASTLNERISRLLTELSLRPIETMGLPRLADVVGARTTAARRLADAAADFGVLTRVGDLSWVAGPTLLRWSAALCEQTAIEDLVEDDLRGLSEATGETIGLALYDAASGTAAFARTFNGTHRVRYVLQLGDIPLHAGAAGKAILAHLPFDPPQKLDSFTERTVTRTEDLNRDLEQIRARGWAIGVGERIPEAYGIAAPFFTDGAVRGSVTITIPRHRMDESLTDDLGDAVLRTCQNLTRLLSVGHQDRAQPDEEAAGAALLLS